MQAISVLIASDVRLYSEGIAQVLGASQRVHVVGTAGHPGSVLGAVEARAPQVVLLDQAMPASLDLLRAILVAAPRCRVVVLGVPAQEAALVAWAEAGVGGFVPRESSLEELIQTVETAVRGEFHCSPGVAGALVRRLAHRASASPMSPPRLPLTQREAEIVRLIDAGLSNKEIAVRLGIEVATVKNHVHNLLEKLRVHRRAEAAARLRGRDPRRPTPQGFPAILGDFPQKPSA